MNYELRIRTAVKMILIFAGLLLFFIFPPLSSYSQSSKNQSKTDKFGGIGVSVDIDSSAGLPYIVDILSAKPGAMAGLRSGDYIISINGWKTKGKSQEKVVNKLRGRVGSKVDLVINRDGKDTVFGMKRERIVVDEKAGNFCEALDTILKSIPDSFHNLEGKEIDPNDYHSKVLFPGIDSSLIRGDNNKFYAFYFLGTDSIEALNKYELLLDKVRDCLPYTICSQYNDVEKPPIKYGTEINYVIISTKENKYKSIIGSDVQIWFGCDQYYYGNHMRNFDVILKIFTQKAK